MLPIEELKKFTFKSFDNYTTSNNYFKQNNYFYGENGEGKSSLIKGIEDICIKRNIRYEYYSKDYIHNIISLEDDVLYGVKLTIGEKNVEKNKELNKKIKEKKNLESGYNILVLEEEAENQFKAMESRCNELHKENKGSTRIRKPQISKEKIEEFFNTHSSNYINNKLNISKSVLTKGADQSYYEEILKNLKKVDDLKIVSCEWNWNELKQILNTEFKKLDVDYSVLTWIEEGVKLHDNKGVVECKFCKNKFNISQRLFEINEMISNETKNKQDELINIKNMIENMMIKLSISNIDSKELLENDEYSKNYSELKIKKIDITQLFKEIIAIIKIKLHSMDESIEFSFEDIQDKIGQCNEIISYLNIIKLNLIEENENNQKIINDIANYKLSKAIIEDTLINDCKEKFLSTYKKIKKFYFELGAINDEIKLIESKMSDTTDVANWINYILNDSNINIQLELKNNNYCLKMRSNSKINLQIENISEGEKGFIAFLYWYFKLYKKFGTKEKDELNSDIKVVLIDDPICSLDNKNNTYLLTLINNIINHNTFQVFVALHEWRDFTNLTFGKNNKDIHKIMEVKKQNGFSQIEDRKSTDSIYKTMYKEINAMNDKDNLEPEDIIKAPNYIRRCLETYLRFNYNIPLATEKSEQDIVEKLEISARQQANFTTLLKVCNIFSHGDEHLYQLSEKDVKTSILCFISVMKHKDEHHHYKMING